MARSSKSKIQRLEIQKAGPVRTIHSGFLLPEAKLAIEVDGAQHADERADQDRERTSFLNTQGITVIRFWNRDVLTNIDGVRDHIHAALGQTAAPHQALHADLSPMGRGKSNKLAES